MSRTVRVIAPAKLNWSLEVLRIRPDGYHEVRSVLQTLALHDVITLSGADAGIELEIVGPAAGMLADAPPESNLAYRAAEALRQRAGVATGVRIRVEKHVPVAAGLGGGSSDAAAVLRGLDRLWSLALPQANLVELAGELGSDPPFFVVGGTASVSGRGEAVEPLRDAHAPSILLATPAEHHRGEKTAAMYAALSPDDFSDGYVSIGVRDVVQAGRLLGDGDVNNVFERVLARQMPETERAMDALRAEGYAPHLCGSGPSFYLLYPGGADLAATLSRRVAETGFVPMATHCISRERALAVVEA